MSTAHALRTQPLPASAVFVCAATLAAALTNAPEAAAQACTTEITAIRQFGTTGVDRAWGVAADAAGNVYVAGHTDGVLPGQSSGGGIDAFVRKYDPAGTEMWTHQFGTAGEDSALDVAVDRATGNIYVVGFVSPFTSLNAFLRKYDTSGNEAWTRQISQVSDAEGVAVDADGNIYVAGFVAGALPGQTSAGSADAYLRKYDSGGNVLWTRQFGSSSFDSASSIAADADGNAYVAGNTGGALPSQTSAGSTDAFLRKYDSTGNEVWTRQFGSSSFDGATGVAADQAGNAFVSGSAMGALPSQTWAGSSDAFIRKYDSAGVEAWTDQFGTPADCPGCSGFDAAFDVAADASGNAYLVGAVVGPLPGETYVGGGDAFVRKYGAAGGVLWTRQFGSPFSDTTTNLAVSESTGKLYASGFTFGTLAGQTSAGNWDAFELEITTDLAAPSLSVALTPNSLWPPDHRLVPVTASIQVTDNCDANPTVSLVSVTSNEPDNGDADGDTVNDVQIVNSTSFLLRAERSAAGTGRVYTVTYVATDASGNASAPATATVMVPVTMK